MSYGLCSLAGWMWNHNWGVYEKISNLEDIMKTILKECEDEYGCKGAGSVHEILSPMKNFKDQ